MPLSSDFRPCLRCGMPDFDHGDGSPTDHTYEPDPDWVEEEQVVAAAAVHENAPDRFTQAGTTVLCDGQTFIETREPEMAQGMVDVLNEAIRIERASRAAVAAKVRADRVKELAHLIANPSDKVGRYSPAETPEHWAARAVMETVDFWL